MPNNGRPNTGGVVQPQLDFILGKVIAYLLYERQQQTELTKAYQKLGAELHLWGSERGHCSTLQPGQTWLDCTSEDCAAAATVLNKERLPEISLNPFTIEMMKAYEVDVLGNMAALVVKLRKKAAVAAVAAGPPKPPPGKIII